MEADEALVQLESIRERVGVVPDAFIIANLEEFGTELAKLFEQEEIPV